MSNRQDVPVYLFTGFLEAGKTKFIQETLEDKRFCNGEKTLLLVCEEGEEEYAPEQFADDSVKIRVVEDQSELNEENLLRFLAETGAERVVIEYNGMWMLDALYNAMPANWLVYQEFMFADAGTFLSYNSNMRQLVYDKLKSCELVVFNRFKPNMDKMEFHKIVRGASRRADIAYEFPGGHVEENEDFQTSVIREVKEETGLTIRKPILCGIEEFKTEDEDRYLMLYYKTDQFSGKLRSSKEGEVFWIKKDDLDKHKLSLDLKRIYKIMTSDELSELIYYKKDGKWRSKIV